LIYFTLDKIVEIQTTILYFSQLPEDAGMDGKIRDVGTLDYLISNGNLLPGSIEQASWYLFGVATKHPFFQGNKRTALMLAALILDLDSNNYNINAEDEEIAIYVEEIADDRHSLDEVEKWLREKIK